MGRGALSVVVTALALASRSASAQPGATESPASPGFQERFTGGLGIKIAASDSTWLHLAFTGEGSARVPGIPSPFMLRARGFFSIAGATVQSDWDGKWNFGGGGAEALACTGGQYFCGVAGVDVGYESADLVNGNDGRLEGSRSGPFVGPRFGIEAGVSRVRARFMVDRNRWKTHHEPSRWMANGGITIVVAARF